MHAVVLFRAIVPLSIKGYFYNSGVLILHISFDKKRAKYCDVHITRDCAFVAIFNNEKCTMFNDNYLATLAVLNSVIAC